MHRLLVTTDLLEQEAPALPSDAARHLKVLRPQSGEKIELFDGRGRSRVFEVQSSKFKARGSGGGESVGLMAVSPTSNFEPSALNLTLFACVTKGSRWDWTIEKATELGVTRIVPVISDRTVVRLPKAERAAKRERWLRIAEDAARQSDAKWLPEIHEAVDFKDVLTMVKETTCIVGALTDPPSPPLISCLRGLSRVSNLSTFIGPEGDFTPEELAALLEIATPASFGPTILRAETAAIFALSVLSQAYAGF